MRTSAGRTEDEQRAWNKKKNEEYKERKRLEALGQKVVASPDDTVTIGTDDLEPAPSLSLKDRMMNRFKSVAPEEKKMSASEKKEAKERSVSFFKEVMPLTFTTLIVTNAEKFFPDPYKPCAPQRQEISAIMLPIFSVISRRVEISTKASQDAIDIGAACVAGIVMGTRMAITRMEITNAIREQNRTHVPIDSRTYTENYGIRTSTNSPAESPGTTGDISSENGTGQSNGSYGDGYAANDDSDAAAYEREKVARLLKRDTEGRRAMGLAPRILPTND